MMGRAFRTAALAALLAVTLPAAMQAQNLYAGVGVGSGVSDFGDATDPGFLANAGLIFPVGDGVVGVGVDGLFGSFGGVSEGPSAKVYGLMGLIDASFGDTDGVHPYVFGAAGLLGFDVDTGGSPGVDGSDSNFGYQAGGGIAIPASETVSVWIDGRYVGSTDVKFIAGVLGLAFAL